MINNVLSTVLILAGGLGTRLRTVIADRPKPMAEVAGRPFLEHIILYWRRQGIKRFILSVGYGHQCIINHFGNHFSGSSIEYIIESKPMGTGGALILCQQTIRLTEPFLLVNGDTYFAVKIQKLQELACKHDADWVFSLFPTKDSKRYLGVRLDKTGRLSFCDSSNLNIRKRIHWANGGVYLIHPRSLINFYNYNSKISLEDEIFPKCAVLKQVFCGHQSRATFIDIGVPEDYFRSQAMPCFLQAMVD